MKAKTKRRVVVQYFLRRLQQRMESDKVNNIDPIFLNLYNKSELMDIIKWLYAPAVPDWIQFDEMDEEGLLEAIGDDYHILNYELHKASEELSDSVNISPKAVHNTLQNLGMETHYLMEKVIAEWNEYDYANYRALSLKAGNPFPLYGIFDRSVKEADKYRVTTPPPQFYETEKEAMNALRKMVADGTLQKGKAKIMML